MNNLFLNLTKVCSNCFASYASGKNYGDYWCEIPIGNVEPKGLCEFCNPNSKWFVSPNGRTNSRYKKLSTV